MFEFTITKKEKIKTLSMLYFQTTALLAFGIFLSYLMAYRQPFYSLFFMPESTQEKPLITFTALLLIFWAPFIIAYFYFRLENKLGANGKLNIAILLTLALSSKISVVFYKFEWQYAVKMLLFAFGAFTIAFVLALLVKKDFSYLKNKWLIVNMALLGIMLLCSLFNIESVNLWLHAITGFCGFVWIFLDVQDLRFRLTNITDQWNFDRLYHHTLINMISGFWLIHHFPDLNKVMIKILTSIFRSQKNH